MKKLFLKAKTAKQPVLLPHRFLKTSYF